ncbi:N-Acetylneuraminate cytidylyltransferase [Paramagnetospirillum magnetotacticum MS-1]|uniref:N-Acetylneuraminate cytidylyltransferase n=1 Tax=Paramagnetospirillum magnetotacticum MS-1 TaxID=272627 RepID=A0A0C2UY81_PARME|nr:acylneuraminate cytidylyltransferase family protein [Paramagnetospirillum magnetotacticum]KIL97766.1 N-Acetylneuraminate cytidylyltransferase [Paramagnetospirillum magnetotacticum MS-1]
MIDGLSVLALITARGGSKGLPGKNVRPLAGRPLVAWSVAQARASALVDRVVISSDDPEIVQAATAAGCEAPFIRPAELASDTASSVEVAVHALEAIDGAYDILVLLQPTSPLRHTADIDACLRQLVDNRAPSCVSVCEAAKSPWWMLRMDEAGTLTRLLEPLDASRRQDLPKVFVANGAVYAVRVPWLLEQRKFLGEGSVGHVMPAERSVDIDTALDFRLAELLAAESLPKSSGNDGESP